MVFDCSCLKLVFLDLLSRGTHISCIPVGCGMEHTLCVVSLGYNFAVANHVKRSHSICSTMTALNGTDSIQWSNTYQLTSLGKALSPYARGVLVTSIWGGYSKLIKVPAICDINCKNMSKKHTIHMGFINWDSLAFIYKHITTKPIK